MKAFISRPLSPESIFLQKMKAAGIDIVAQSLIRFAAYPFQKPAQADWLFFYSKKGIKYYFEGLDTFDTSPKIACLGQGTAKFLFDKTGLRADFIGSGQPDETAKAFSGLAKGLTVAFIRALNSKKSVQLLLEKELKIIDCIVYSNYPKEGNYAFSGEVLVFTSPMNADIYFAQNKLEQGQQVVAIGQSTAKALQALDIHQIEIAEEPSELALADAVLKLIV